MWGGVYSSIWKRHLIVLIMAFYQLNQNSIEYKDGSSGSGRGLWGLDGVGSGQGQMAGTCEYDNELSGSIK